MCVEHIFEAYSCIEYFAGSAWVTKSFRYSGLPAAALDVEFGNAVPGMGNSIDLLTTCGMAFLRIFMG